ncbi:hypothetical protein KSS93_10980 [Pseudomonas xanthosomatis]|uniref:hypothetical protein n=1 Tax=Pseudomonas xanthosomatis TaxID=2842356 RepID=UPI001C3E719F|nr:hypothetical protein [Pseudomonas xanthosomatis]QXH48399.1 hypothetical protein KSS93_10980 [Pseudomonas xanthosomatis]
MATNNLAELLAWMKQHPSHLNWDYTLAMHPQHANNLVQMAHYSREGSALGDIEGDIPVPGTHITHVLSGYRMGPPQLDDLQAAYESPRVRQAITLEGGTQLIMDKTEGLMGLAVHDPLDPLWVRQELALSADTQGVRADLRDGIDTELDLGGGLQQRLAAGRFFMEFVSGLDIARRVYPLVDFQALLGNPYLGVRDSAVRTHISKTDGKAALVVFASVNNGPTGDFPSEKSNFPFLLVDDLQQPVTSTLLLSSRLLHRAAYAQGLEQMLEGGAFEAFHDKDQTLLRLDAKAGQLRVYPCEYQGHDYAFSCEEFVIPVTGAPAAAGMTERALGGTCCCCATPDNRELAPEQAFVGPLSVEFDADEVRQRWASHCTLSFSFKANSNDFWQNVTATFRFDLRTLFHLVKPSAAESAGCLLLGQVLWPWEQTAEVTPVSGLPGGLSDAALAEINAFVAFLIKQAVLEGLAKKLSAAVPEQLIEHMPLAADYRFNPFHFELPNGMALFANQSSTAFFRVVDPPQLLAPGQRHTFSVEPATEGVAWALEGLPGSVGDIGRIDAKSGEYRAPPAHAMGGQQVRARVVATDPFSGQRSTSMVTVVLAALTVNPLVQVCYFEDQLTLSAGTLEGKLQWEVLDPGAEGRGSLRPDADGKRCTYTAGSAVADNRTYVLDQVKVHNAQTGEAAMVHVLVRQRRPEMDVLIAQQLPDGSLQLQGRVNGQVMPDVQWTLQTAEAGYLSPEGLYTPPSSDTARFALITGKWEFKQGGLEFLFEGHLILPLPLALHFDALRRIHQPAGLRAGTQPLSGE